MLPGLLSQQPYQNVRWTTIPSVWQLIYKYRFKISLHHDYYSGNCFRAKVFRHIVYMHYYLETTKDLEYDYYAFSLSLFACALHQNIISFENMIDIFFDLECRILSSKDKYKMCIITADESCVKKTDSFLKPCFIGKKSHIYHLLNTDEFRFINLMQNQSMDYILNDIEYPFHSQSCPLYSNPIPQTNIKISTSSCSRNIYNLNAESLDHVINNLNQIFTAKIQFSSKLKKYEHIFEAASRIQLISLLKDRFPGIENNICFDILDSDSLQ